MSQVSGIIKKKSVKATAYGDKISFLVGGQWLSAFATDKKLSPDAKELLKSLSDGDEAEFQIVENKSKDGSQTYLNIVGIEKVTRLNSDLSEPPDDEPVHPVGHDKGFPYSMKVSYCKDLMIAFPNDSEVDLLGRVEMVKKMASLMGE